MRLRIPYELKGYPSPTPAGNGMTTQAPDKKESPALTVKTDRPSQHILIIQSASRVLKKTLASLKQEFPEASFSILTAQPGSTLALSGDPTIRVLPLPADRRISLFSYGIKKRQQLRQQNFDLAIVLYNTQNGRGYANVESLAWSTGAKELRGYFPDGSYSPLSKSGILKNSLSEKTAVGWVALNIITAVLLLAVTGIYMAGEAVYRRLTRDPAPQPPSRKERSA